MIVALVVDLEAEEYRFDAYPELQLTGAEVATLLLDYGDFTDAADPALEQVTAGAGDALTEAIADLVGMREAFATKLRETYLDESKLPDALAVLAARIEANDIVTSVEERERLGADIARLDEAWRALDPEVPDLDEAVLAALEAVE